MIWRERSIKDSYRRSRLQSSAPIGLEMRVAITFVLFAGVSLAAPQFEGIKNLFSSLAGGDTQEEDSGTEKVPYTTLKQFDRCEMRLYPSVKWACTEVAVEVEEDEAVASLKALQSWNSNKKDRKNRPQSQMFMKLFR